MQVLLAEEWDFGVPVYQGALLPNKVAFSRGFQLLAQSLDQHKVHFFWRRPCVLLRVNSLSQTRDRSNTGIRKQGPMVLVEGNAKDHTTTWNRNDIGGLTFVCHPISPTKERHSLSSWHPS